jgi:hypothetical protein
MCSCMNFNITDDERVTTYLPAYITTFPSNWLITLLIKQPNNQTSRYLLI